MGSLILDRDKTGIFFLILEAGTCILISWYLSTSFKVPEVIAVIGVNSDLLDCSLRQKALGQDLSYWALNPLETLDLQKFPVYWMLFVHAFKRWLRRNMGSSSGIADVLSNLFLNVFPIVCIQNIQSQDSEFGNLKEIHEAFENHSQLVTLTKGNYICLW